MDTWTGERPPHQDELETLINEVLTPLYEQVRAQARRDAVLVDGLVVPMGERDGVDGLFSDDKGFCGQNVQVVAAVSGRLADVGEPCPGSTHDSRAFDESGIAVRWATHYQRAGAGMIGGKGCQGTGIRNPVRNLRDVT